MPYLPVREYENLYEVSESGQVRSIARNVIGKDGVVYPKPSCLLRPSPNKQVEYPQVSLWKNGEGVSKYVHRLVAEAHIPNPNNLPEVNHKDGNRQNSHFNNLEWVSSLENKLHAIQTGLHIYINRLTKEEFVTCLFDVIAGESYLSLTKRVPYKVPFLSVKLRKIAKELGIENELDDSLYFQKIERARINGAKNNQPN